MKLDEIAGALSRHAGIRARAQEATAAGGGSISRAFHLPSDRGPIFLKVNTRDSLAMFEAEAEGLDALRAAHAIAIPETLAVGCVGSIAYLALQWVDFGPKTPGAQRRLGQALARQHRVTGERFGWHRDNTIGSTPQPNSAADSWLEFFARQRLGFQLALAEENGLPRQEASRLSVALERLDSFFDGYAPDASLLHGDLWSGNWAATPSGEPYVFDPAVYFGDREADLAMTRLFGGFGAAFYDAYQAEWPLAHGWEARVELYNLYHLLNHFNIFGIAYLAQISGALDRISGSLA